MSRTFLFRSSAGIDHYQVEDENGTRYESVQNTDEIVDRNKAAATHNDGYNATRDLRRVASIPYVIALKWLNEEGWWMFDPANADRLKKKLNDPDWRHLRTADGYIDYKNGVLR